MEYAQISIISIFLNDMAMLKIVMDSVLNQSYSEIQHVISIGASKDGSIELLKEYEPKYLAAGKVLTWTDRPDTCISQAYNNCFHLIDLKSKYVLLLSNPYMGTESLERQMDYLLKGNYDALFCGAIMQKDGKIVRRISGGGNPKNWRLGWQGTTESFIFSKQVLDETGYFDEILYVHTYGEDYDFFLRVVINKKWKIGSLNKPIVNYIAGGISNSKKLEMIKSFYMVLKIKNVKFPWVTVAGKCLRVLFSSLPPHKPISPEMRVKL